MKQKPKAKQGKYNIRYSTNWMGVANMQWYQERGLTRKKTITMTEDSLLVKHGQHKPGDVIEIDEVTESYSCGRIDFWNPYKDSMYPDEMGVPPMRSEDWRNFGTWLSEFKTYELLDLEQLVREYEKTNPKIRWAETPRWER